MDEVIHITYLLPRKMYLFGLDPSGTPLWITDPSESMAFIDRTRAATLIRYLREVESETDLLQLEVVP